LYVCVHNLYHQKIFNMCAMQLRPEIKANIDNYFDNVTAEELLEKSLKHGFDVVTVEDTKQQAEVLISSVRHLLQQGVRMYNVDHVLGFDETLDSKELIMLSDRNDKQTMTSKLDVDILIKIFLDIR